VTQKTNRNINEFKVIRIVQDELNQLASKDLMSSDAVHGEFLPQEFYYHITWRSRGVQAGSHKTKQRGAGSDFSSYATLLECPDPRRLDVRASLRTIPKQLMVRTFFERSAIKVYAVNDISSSTQFVGKLNKQQVLLDTVEAIAWSATRQGDAFGMLCCDDHVQTSLSILPTYRSAVAQEIRQLLQNYFSQPNPTTKSALALPQAAINLGAQRALVFIISDFHLPDALIHETFRAYAMHDVVPIILWDEAEFQDIPSWGLARVREMETGIERSFFMRPAMLQSIRNHAESRRSSLAKLCQQHGFRPPFFVTSQFDATALTRHLLGA
jgi:uncharacterized protein (DUF58 family)